MTATNFSLSYLPVMSRCEQGREKGVAVAVAHAPRPVRADGDRLRLRESDKSVSGTED